ncbi:MAG: hypothetical protein KDC95_24500, partial [Planctomycetes bacterium]|nr:hypothetical protein [Planctomycetota bacterium]
MARSLPAARAVSPIGAAGTAAGREATEPTAMTRTPENPYRVLLGTSVALFLALALAVPLAWL